MTVSSLIVLVYCITRMLNGVTLEENNKMASIKWNSLTVQEKEKYKDIAGTNRQINVSNLTTGDKKDSKDLH